MSERPILFSAPMVRALLAGTKKQTRRIAKLNAAGRVARGGRNWHPDDPAAVLACPYGSVGGTLWVRETWYSPPRPLNDCIGYAADDHPHGVTYRKRPAIHMARAASRLTLEITAVRVERLQDISEDDAKAEGTSEPRLLGDSYTENYRLLWESINGPGSWDANPWVWVIELKRAPETKAGES